MRSVKISMLLQFVASPSIPAKTSYVKISISPPKGSSSTFGESHNHINLPSPDHEIVFTELDSKLTKTHQRGITIPNFLNSHLQHHMHYSRYGKLS